MLYKVVKNLGVGALCMLAVVSTAQARRAERIVKSEKGFYRTLSRRPFVVAYFYDECNDAARNAHARGNRKALDRAVSMLSGSPAYKEGDLLFVKVNVGRSDLANVAQESGVQETPAFALFRFGNQVRNQDDSRLLLVRPADGAQLRNFIEQNLGDDIADRIEQKVIDRARRDAARAYYWNYWGYGAPYPYFSGYPYGRIGFGFTI